MDRPTFTEFMGIWRVRPYDLALFHVERSFALEVISEMSPWIERAQHVRQMVYLNATDPSRKDQWLWMQRYQQMLTDKMGDNYLFLPEDPAYDRKRRSPADQPAPEALTVPIFDDPDEAPPPR